MIPLTQTQVIQTITASGFEVTGMRHTFDSDPMSTIINIALKDADGNVVKNQSIVLDGAQHDDFWDNHYNTDPQIVDFLSAKLGLPVTYTPEQAAAMFTDTPAVVSALDANAEEAKAAIADIASAEVVNP